MTLVFHSFWAHQGAEAQLQMVQLLKNVSIGGGLLAIFSADPGALGVDARRAHVGPAHGTPARDPA